MEHLNKRQLLIGLIAIDLTLVFLHVVSATIISDHSWTVANWFNLDAEVNIPTWFSSSKLALIAILALVAATQLEQGPLRRALILAALAFLFLSMDETASIHEGTTQLIRSVGVDTSRPYVPGAWTLVYPALGLLALVIFRREAMAFLADVPGRAAFLRGAALFLAGGLVLEIAAYFIVPKAGADSVYAFIQICLEECLEMTGASLMAYAMLLKARPEGPVSCS